LLRKKGAFGEIEFENTAEFEDFMEKHRAQIIPIIIKNGSQPARLISGYTSKEKAPDKLLFIKKDSFDYSTKSEKKEKAIKTKEQ